MGEAMGRLTRRTFLARVGLGGLALASAGAGAGLLASCASSSEPRGDGPSTTRSAPPRRRQPAALGPADVNGLRVQPGFTSRQIATTGQTVAGTDYPWHSAPDGGACFALAGGGWSYVSNSEAVIGGGASYVRFADDGAITGAGRCLSDTVVNCAGGATPWDTWLSCEETPGGRVWECHPTGAEAAVVREAMGRFKHEAVAADPANRCLYLTEDESDGALYRFVPSAWGELAAGTLEVLTESDGALAWTVVPDPSGATTATRHQVADTKRFDGGEGIAMSNGGVVFTTKGDNRVWRYDPAENALAVVYDDDVQVNGILTGVDNVGTSAAGAIYVAEDGGDMQIVLVRADGAAFPVVELIGVSGSEMTGPAFDPSGTRLYFSSQRNPGATYEVEGPWAEFDEPNA